jgi:hypothetical protein
LPATRNVVVLSIAFPQEAQSGGLGWKNQSVKSTTRQTADTQSMSKTSVNGLMDKSSCVAFWPNNSGR